jgi:triacylglycerol lipase
MRSWRAATILAVMSLALSQAVLASNLSSRLDRLEAEIRAAEDVRAIKKLQRAYGYYLDKGQWQELSVLFTDDAVANYPAGVFVGKESIRKHLYLNVGGGNMGDTGLAEGRLYNHMSIQPVVHLEPDGKTAKGRWRALAMFGSYGGNAMWAEGVYEIAYAKQRGVWKIKTLDYYSGFGAPYQTGWVAPEQPRAPGSGVRRKLKHPPDRERKMECDGFPAACIAPFHYETVGNAWNVPARRGSRDIAQLAHRALLLEDEQKIENLQRIYGYYLDRAMWDQVADLFAEDGTIEFGQQGVYAGKNRVRQFLGSLGPHGLRDGWLNDHIQLQIIVDVAPDGQTARVRSREWGMTGEHGQSGTWSEGIYENGYVKEGGVWKIQSLHFYPTFITDYDKGWARDAQPVPTASKTLPPDRPPTERYEIYPKAHVPPFHYSNPVTGPQPRKVSAPRVQDVDTALSEAERRVQQVKDYHDLENLESAYGYYLDKNLWNRLADLFAQDSSMELAQRGVYRGQPRIREFLLTVFGRGQEGPVAGRLGNHIQMQPVISIAEDGQHASIRVRMLQQMSFGPRASLGAAIYENEAVKEQGVWKIKKLHAYNTFTASYEGGWAKGANRTLPGPSKDLPPDAPPTRVFESFPAVYDIPFHYANPVTGRTETPRIVRVAQSSAPAGMPADIAAKLREIGPRIEAQQTTALYVPLLPKEPYTGVAVTRDIQYGPHERHVLDVFTSPGKNSKASKPVLVFIHGGGFTRGAKRAPGSPFYDNVMLWAQSQGYVGVNINYRLAPDYQWPSGIEDLTRVVSWLKANIAKHGGDPARIFLWGHSAGAAHAADYLAHREAGVAGAILTSGFYEPDPVWKAYYGEDRSKYAQRAALPGLVKSSVPLLVVDAELDPEQFSGESDKLAAARAKAGRPVRRLRLPGHSHLSETYAIGTSDESLSGPVKEFIGSVVGP